MMRTLPLLLCYVLLSACATLPRDDQLSSHAQVQIDEDSDGTGFLQRAETLALTSRYEQTSNITMATTYLERIDYGFWDAPTANSIKNYWGMQASALSSDKSSQLQAEYGFGSFDASNGEGFGDADHRHVRVNGSTSLADTRVGFSFSSTGKEFAKPGAGAPRDREGGEIWWSQRYGQWRVKQYASRYFDNIERDAGRRRLTDERVGIQTDYTLSSAPSWSYAAAVSSGDRASSFEQTMADLYSARLVRASVSLNYSSGVLDSSLSSNLTRAGELLATNPHSFDRRGYQLVNTLKPRQSLRMTSAISRSEQRASNGNLESAGQTARVAMRYQPTGRKLRVSAYATGNWQRYNDRLDSHRDLQQGFELAQHQPIGDLLPGNDVVLRVSYARCSDSRGVEYCDGGAGVWLGIRSDWQPGGGVASALGNAIRRERPSMS